MEKTMVNFIKFDTAIFLFLRLVIQKVVFNIEEMNPHYYVAILAGGYGMRLWPKSREKNPKQFLDFLNTGKTLIQYTYERFEKFIPKENIFIVTNEEYVGLVKEQLPDIKEHNILQEPFRKGTALGVTYIALKLLLKDPNATMIVSPSDQIIMDQDIFAKVILQAFEFANAKKALVTIGIQPTFPNTHYGYIQRGAAQISNNIYKVKTFTEKPPLDMAQTFISSGDFLWNAGIFIWRAADIIAELQKYQPEMLEFFEEEKAHLGTSSERDAMWRTYSQCSNMSIDLAVMERTENVYIIPCSIGWSDLGTWNNVYDNMEKDYLGSALSGDNIVNIDSAKCIVSIPENKIAVVQGLDNHIVVDTKDVLFICKKENEHEMIDYIAEVRRKRGIEFL